MLFCREKWRVESDRIADLIEDGIAPLKKTAKIDIFAAKKIPLNFAYVFCALFGAMQFFRAGSLLTAFVWMIVGGGVSTVVISKINSGKIDKRQREIVYSIPLVMERIVMAAEAGLDILPAIKAVVAIEEKQSSVLDPVTSALALVLYRAEQGELFENSLKAVAEQSKNVSLTHAFFHLGIAQREGGELIGPLRELSEATRCLYQDTIKEELAKLPVKATAPLVVMFAGLILFFLSSPLIQIVSFAAKAKP